VVLRRSIPLAVASLVAGTLAACGGGGSHPPAKLAITLSGAGKAAKYTVPASVKGGVVEVRFHNAVPGGPHAAQLLRVDGSHTPPEALKALGGKKIPAWLHAEGGVGPIPSSTTSTAIRNLRRGSYLVADVGGPPSGIPPYAAFKVGNGKPGKLPHARSTVDAVKVREHRYAWKLSGAPLKAGANQVHFKSGGADALHFLGVFKVTGNPSYAAILKGLSANGPPPKFVDPRSFFATAVLDGGKSEVTRIQLSAGPGEYVLFCPLTDREGGKPHFAEGLLKRVRVK
jgi:hypothetical protein